MSRKHIRAAALLAALAALAVGLPYAPQTSDSLASTPHFAQQTGASQYFPETGQTVSGRFLDYWNNNGSLMQQGYPISGEMQEKSDTDGNVYTVQYFQRAVFEYRPENQPPYDVLLSLLGATQYASKYPAGAPGQQPDTSPGSALFAETGHRLGGLFLNYWNTHGSLMQQGYPISDPFTEVSALNGQPYTVQYFQRAVFEWHPENQPPYDVLLSQLGTFQFDLKYAGTNNTGGTGGTGSSGGTSGTDGTSGTGGVNTGGSSGSVGTQEQGGAADKCSPSSETPASPFDTDGCPGTFDQWRGAVTADVNNFWSQTFAASGKSYTPPAAITPYSTTIRTACGRSVPNNAFYCGPDNTIYFDSNFVQNQLAATGDFAAAVIIAHEWGHLVQTDLSIMNGNYHSIDIELQADCMAGAWAKHAEQAGELETGDVDAAASSLYQMGDPANVPWFARGAHGTPQQREDSFNTRYSEGVQGCLIAGSAPGLAQGPK